MTIVWIAVLLSAVDGGDLEYYAGHEKGIVETRLSPDGDTLATVAGDGQIILRRTNDLSMKRILKQADPAFSTLCFSRDGRYLLATGGLEDFNSVSDGFVQFDLRDESRQFVKLPLVGGIREFNLTDQESHVTYLCVDELCHFSLKSQRFSTLTNVPMPIHAVAVSPEERQYAFFVSSAERRVEEDAVITVPKEPCRLIIMRPSGGLTLTQVLPADPEFRNSIVHFINDQRVLICQGSGAVLVWNWNSKEKNWAQDGSPVAIRKDRYWKICTGLSPEVCWLGSADTLIAVNVESGKIIKEIKLNVEEAAGESFQDSPITGLTLVPKQKKIIASLWSGKIAAVSIQH